MAQRSNRRSSSEESQPRSEYWRDQSEAWQTSGLTQAQFCVERGLSLSAFRWWRWKLKQEEQGHRGSMASLTPSEGSGQGIRLVPVHVVDPEAQSPTSMCSSSTQAPSVYEVLLESGSCIRVPGDFDAESLSRLLRTLEAVGC